MKANKLILLALLLAMPAAATSRREQVERMKNLAVLIGNEGFLGGSRGSGVLMDATHVLTCAHMVSSPTDEFFVYTYPLGVVTRAKVEAIDFHVDLALLKLDKAVQVLDKPVFQDDVYDGEPITIVGNSLGSMKWYVTVGVVSGKERDYIMTDAQAKPGNSGGPWFNEKGEIVALTDWGLNNHENITGGVSAKTIHETLAGWANSKKMIAALTALLGGK